MPGTELRGRRIGLVGFGGIAREVARICTGIGMEVVPWNRSPFTDSNACRVELDELLATSDVVSLHLGLHEQTRGFMSAERLRRMKSGSILVNTARGALLDEATLITLLQTGHIGHAGLDVDRAPPRGVTAASLGRVELPVRPPGRAS